MTQAQIAVRAAKGARSWGRRAARRYALNRGVPLQLFQLALMLEREA